MIQRIRIFYITAILLLLLLVSFMFSCNIDVLQDSFYEDGPTTITRTGEVVVTNTRSYDITFSLVEGDNTRTRGTSRFDSFLDNYGTVPVKGSIRGTATKTVPANGSVSWTISWEDVSRVRIEKRRRGNVLLLNLGWKSKEDVYSKSTEYHPRENPIYLIGSVVDSNGCSIPAASEAPDKSKSDEFELRNITRVEINYAFEKTESGTDYCDWRGADHLGRIGL